MEKNEEALFDVSFDSISDNDFIDTEATGEVASEQKLQETKVQKVNKTEESKDKDKEDEIELDFTDQKTTSKSSKENTPDPGEDSSPLIPFASLLQEKGFLSNLDLEEFKKADDKYEALSAAFKKEDELRMEAIISKFPEELIDMAKAVAEGVPFDKIKEHKVKELNFNSITEDKLSEEETAIKVIRENLSIKGFKQAKIDKLIDTYKDLGSIEEEAKEALPEIKDYYKQQQELVKKQFQEQQKELENKHKEVINSIQSTVKSTEEIVPGLKLNEVAKSNLFKNMTQIVGQDQNGNPINYVMQMRSKDPVKFDMAVTYLADITKGFTDWSKINKTVKTNTVKEFEKTLQSTGYSYGKPKKPESKEASTEDLISSLEKLFGK